MIDSRKAKSASERRFILNSPRAPRTSIPDVSGFEFKTVWSRFSQIEFHQIVDRPGRLKITHAGLQCEFGFRQQIGGDRGKVFKEDGWFIDCDSDVADVPFQECEF